jgi:predicted metal-dependent peptidase
MAKQKIQAQDFYDSTAYELALRDLLCAPKNSSGGEIFYGQLLSQFKRIDVYNSDAGKNKWFVPTAAVAIEANQVVLIINHDFFEGECDCATPDFTDFPHDLPEEMRGMRFCNACGLLEVGLTPGNRKAILKHECQHIAHRHLTRRDGADYEPRKANIAMDSCINEFNDDLPKGCIDFRQIDGAVPDQNWETRYELLKQEEENGQGSGQCGSCDGSGQQDDGQGGSQDCPDCDGTGQGGSSKWGQSFDDHRFFGETDGETNIDIADELLKDQIKKAAEQVGIGNVPAGIREEIANFNNEAKVNWRKVLRNWMQESIHRDRRLDARSESRCVPGIFPGQAYLKTPEFDVYVDASGSIGSEEFNQFMAEVLDINASLKASVNLHQWDTQVHHSEKLEPGHAPELIRAACGGTDCGCVIEHAWENKNKNIIIMTDGFFSPVDTTGLNVLWVYTPYYEDQGGKGIVLDDLEK